MLTKRLLLTLCAALSMLCGSAQMQKPLPTLHVEGKWLVDQHGNHVVLHGVMDTPSAWFNSGRWGWSYDDAGRQRCLDYFEKLYTGLEKANCDVFRLHLEPAWTNDNSYTWPGSVNQPSTASGEADIKHFNPTRLTNYLKTLYFPLMQKAMKHGMYVVVRPPGVCPGSLKVGDYYQQYLMTVWDIVTKNDSIRKYAGQISIELANEPVSLKNASGQDDKKALHDYFQPIVEKARANGFTGIIWIPGTGWQSSYADYATYPIEGYNIGYAVHDYDGWYGCEDKKLTEANLEQAKRNKIAQFKKQVPVVETNPVIITEIDWSPKKPGSGHTNEHGEWVESNYGTWATGRTSMWGAVTKAVHEHYGNISMTLSGTACLIDIDTLLEKNGKVVPAFGGLEEACGKACMDWYADYKNADWAHPDFASAPFSDRGIRYENPIVRADFPDPDVIRVGNTYYMISTTMHHFPGATILKSQDMVNWEYCAHPLAQLSQKDAYKLLGSASAYGSGMWACSMKYHNGKFHVLINEKLPVDGWQLQGWLLTATNPEGQWEMKKLSRSYYDPGMLFDDGKVYVACGIGNIAVCELDENFNFKRDKTVITDRSSLEGCHFYKRGEYYYIYATYGGWPSGQAVFRSKNVFGPYEEQMVVEKIIDGVPNTIHQGALIEDTKGKWWTIMQQDLGALGRFPNLQPVTWRNDWPVVGNGGKPYSIYTKPACVGDNRVKRLPTTDAFRKAVLEPQWEWNHYPDDEAWSLTERPGWLRLHTSGTAATLPEARGMLTQRIFANAAKPSTGTVRLDVSGLADGNRAGICIFQDPFAMICVERNGEAYRIVWQQDKVRDAGSEFTPDTKSKDVELPDGIVYLRAKYTYGGDKNISQFYYSLDNETWTLLGGETKFGFNLTVFVGARFGLFCYTPDASNAGHADFDWFSTAADFDEEATYPEFAADTEDAHTATRLTAATVEVITGSHIRPRLTATFKDKHTADVFAQADFECETPGIVEFKGGEMFGVGQGSTKVKASYTDPLGNKVETTFTARASYFPFDAQYITNVVGDGLYKQNSTYGSFRFAKDGQIGWIYLDGIDISDYRFLVVRLPSKTTSGAHLNIYPTTNHKGACFSSEVFDNQNTEFVIDLEAAKYTSTTNKGRALARNSIQMITFEGPTANRIINVKEMFLSNDPAFDPDGVVDMAAAPQQGLVSVYGLDGRLVRSGVERTQALSGLPAGLYIVGGRKVLKR